jgi:hypothetical protein
MTPILIKSFLASATCAAYTIAAFDGTGAQVENADSASAKSLGVFDAQGAVAGQMSDVIQIGWGEVKLGGTVAAGDELTADADGNAVAIAAEATARSIGTAQAAGVEGDIIPVLVNPSTVTLPA